MKVGFGWDIHRLVTGRKLILGGVEIPFEKGLLGHSDADVLLHAVCDAMLGAAGLGDIGVYFPDSDPGFKEMSSLWFLKKTEALLSQKGFRVVNMDGVIVAQTPKLSPYRSAMTETMANALGIEPSRINVKFKTAEELGPVGAGEAISAMCTLLIEEI
ncbi:MAG: 2-C-methyl-D-erythritol 2,4-cyclodiphosphate synthase [Thermodesulfobacteriota bacterium]